VALACGALVLGYVLWRPRVAPPTETRLFLGGDVHFGANEPNLGEVASLVAPGVGIVNLEGPTTSSSADAKASSETKLLNATTQLAALRKAGVQVVGIANNHARDVAPNESARHARQAGLVAAGTEPAVLVSTAGRIVVTAHELGALSMDELRRDLRAARDRGEVLVATFHVTGPPSYVPRPELRTAVDIAVEAGARVIASHGTHALGPIERRGDAVIAWGLGNLLFSCPCTREREGAILEVTIKPDRTVSAALVPIAAGLDGEPARIDRELDLTFDLLRAIGSTPFERRGPRAVF